MSRLHPVVAAAVTMGVFTVPNTQSSHDLLRESAVRETVLTIFHGLLPRFSRASMV